MNHYEGNHWASYHFASNHFWGEGASTPDPVVPGSAGMFDIHVDMSEVRRKVQQVENNRRVALLVALIEGDDWP